MMAEADLSRSQIATATNQGHIAGGMVRMAEGTLVYEALGNFAGQAVDLGDLDNLGDGRGRQDWAGSGRGYAP